jgi:uncharacterized membrane protein YphA (DoxX/SURF4 family)
MSVSTAIPGEATSSTAKTIALWVTTGLLAFVFVMAGSVKFVNPEVAKQVARWGYPDWTRVLVAMVEIGGGLALLLPRTAPYATGALGTVLVGAVFTHLRHGAVPHAAVPLAVLALLVMVGYARRPRTLAQDDGRKVHRPVKALKHSAPASAQNSVEHGRSGLRQAGSSWPPQRRNPS